MKRIRVRAKCSGSAKDLADMKFHRILALMAFCILSLMMSPAMHGQASGSFSGNVVDKSGSAIPGAAVKATSQGTGLSRDTKTDSCRTLPDSVTPGRDLHRARRHAGFSERGIQRSASPGG